MRSITLRPGESFTTGDTAISVYPAQRAMVAAKLANMGQGRPSENAQICAVSQPDAAKLLNVSTRAVAAAPNPIEHQTNQQWLADYEREERRLSGGRVR